MRHSNVVLAGWDCLLDLVHGSSAEVVVNGESLRLAKVVAVARLVILISLNFSDGQSANKSHGVLTWDRTALLLFSIPSLHVFQGTYPSLRCPRLFSLTSKHHLNSHFKAHVTGDSS